MALPLIAAGLRAAAGAVRTEVGGAVLRQSPILKYAAQFAGSAMKGGVKSALVNAKESAINKGPAALFKALGGNKVPILDKAFKAADKARLAGRENANKTKEGSHVGVVKNNTSALNSLSNNLSKNTEALISSAKRDKSEDIIDRNKDAQEEALKAQEKSREGILSKIADDVEEIRQNIRKLQPSESKEESGGLISGLFGAIKGLIGGLLMGGLKSIAGLVSGLLKGGLSRLGSLGKGAWELGKRGLSSAGIWLKSTGGAIADRARSFGGSMLTAGKSGLARAASFFGIGAAATQTPGLVSGAAELTKSPTSDTLDRAGKVASEAPTVKRQAIDSGDVALKASPKGKVAQEAGEIALKTGGKSLSKKIPLLGALAGLGFAGSRAWEGDWTGAGMELTSGIMGAIPGFGTAGSLAMDAAILKRDLDRAENPESPVEEPGLTLKDIWESTKTAGAGVLSAGGGLLAAGVAGASGLFGSIGSTITNGGALAGGLLTGGALGAGLTSATKSDTPLKNYTEVLKQIYDLMSDENKGIFVKPSKDPFSFDSTAGVLDSIKGMMGRLFNTKTTGTSATFARSSTEKPDTNFGGSLDYTPPDIKTPTFLEDLNAATGTISALPSKNFTPGQFDMRSSFKSQGAQIGDNPAENAANAYAGLKAAFEKRGFTPEQSAIFAEAGAAQFALESGWGKSQSGKNNFFGIKARPGEDATYKKTQEFENGRMVTKLEPFKNFESIEAGMEGYVDFVIKNQRYAKAGAFESNTPQEYLESMQRAGYATDPNYASKLGELIAGRTFQSGMQIAQSEMQTGPVTPIIQPNQNLDSVANNNMLTPVGGNASDSLQQAQTEVMINQQPAAPAIVPVPIPSGGQGGSRQSSPGLNGPIVTRTTDNAINALTMNFIGHSMAIA